MRGNLKGPPFNGAPSQRFKSTLQVNASSQ
jgi:hypothetical protein